MGGEYLPYYLPGEVEIARISLESTTADVISLRARLAAGKLRYRIVDEYDTSYLARPAESARPLTLGELIDMIECASGDGMESFVDALRRNSDPDGEDPDAALSFVSVTSDFYPDVGNYYAQPAQRRNEARNKAPRFEPEANLEFLNELFNAKSKEAVAELLKRGPKPSDDEDENPH
jgi:hypothetical protein